MRLNFVVLLFTLFTCLLYSCNNDELEIEKEYTFSNRFSEINDFKESNLFTEEYRKTFGALISRIDEINLKKNEADILSLVTNYQRVLTSTPTDSADANKELIRIFNSIYSVGEQKELNTLFDQMKRLERGLIDYGKVLSFDAHEQNLFMGSLALEFPRVKKGLKMAGNKMVRTRSEIDVSDCINACEDSYYWELMSIAVDIFCYGIGAIYTACQSLGSLTIPALIALIVGVSQSSIDIDIATAQYNLCVKECNGR